MRHLVPLAVPCLILSALNAHADPTPPAPILIRGQRPAGAFGFQVAPAADFDGDGFPDLLVGAPADDVPMAFAGRAHLIRRPMAPHVADRISGTRVVIATTPFGDNLGFSIASAGDVDGDGREDLLVGARSNDAGGIQAGRVYVFRGPVSATQADAATAVITGTPFEEIGRSVSAAGDLNGDGFGDILVGTGVGGPGDEGRVYVFNGPVSGSLTLADADAVVVGAVPDDALGAAVAPAGDLDGDGFADIVVGAPRTVALGNTNGPGQVYVFHGPLQGTVTVSSAAAVLVGEQLNDNFGVSVSVGDVNGDGVRDLVVGADQLFRNDGAGRIYVFHGPLAGSLQAANANGIVRGAAIDDLLGSSVWAADLDGDGRSDVIAGAPGASLASGRGYVFRGPVTGSLNASAAAFAIDGAAGDQLGNSVCAIPIGGSPRSAATFGAPSQSIGGLGYVAIDPNALPILTSEPKPQVPATDER